MRFKTIILTGLIFSGAANADQYQNYEDLASHETLGVDYKIIVKDQKSSISLLAIHGGKIETGTSELIEEIGGPFNQYHFMGQKKANNFSLHITSSRFDEPQAVELTKRSKQCIAFHGYIGMGETAVCIGGGNNSLAKKIAHSLTEAKLGFDVIYPCARYPGLHPQNIVNLCEEQGVQIEMSGEVRARLKRDEIFRETFAKTLRNIL